MKKMNGKLATIERLVKTHDLLVKLMAKDMEDEEKAIQEMEKD